MKTRQTLTFLLLILCTIVLKSQIIEGTLENITIHSQAIEGNLFNDNPNQDVAIYLPPSYYTNSNKKYPVLYFLCGYYDIVEYWTETGHFQGFRLKDNMDKLINEGEIKEMIVVIPNSYTFLEGSFFTNSSVNGNYEDFYTQELIEYINSNYRTINSRDARAIAGHSMGGTGALDLSMKYPDIYCMGYGLCSGLFAPDWFENSLVFRSPISSNEATIRTSISLFDRLREMSEVDAHSYYTSVIDSLKSVTYGWMRIFGYAYGTAYAGDSSLHAPYFNYPFYLENDTIKTDSIALSSWENGFGNLPEKINTYKDNLLNLKEYVIDYGDNDFWSYIISGNIYYHELLEAEGIPHKFINNGGDHDNIVKEQLETSILPLCNNTLEFDTINLSTESTIINLSLPQQVGDINIDSGTKTIEVLVSAEADLALLCPVIQTSLGADISPKSRETVDFSQGSATYTVISENGLNSEEWIVSVSQESSALKNIDDTREFVYPNPVADILNISCEIADKIEQIDMYNMSGLKIYTTTQIKSIPVSNLKSGIYNIKIKLISGEIIYQSIEKE